MRAISTFCLAIAISTLTTTALPREAVSLNVVEARDEGQILYSPGREAMKQAYRKYGSLPALGLKRRVAPLASKNGVVSATPVQSDTYYLSPVSVGSPASTYSAIIDTGSSQVSFYAPKLGKSGSVTTPVAMGGITVQGQAVSLSSDSSGQSNIVGMAPASGSWYSNAVAQGAISAVFTANLKPNATGSFGLGFIDTTAYTGSITYVPANTSQGFWGTTSNGYSIGTGAFVTQNVNGIIDTRTTLLLLPDSVVNAYYKQVSGAAYNNEQGGYVFACSTKLPDLTLGFSTYRATVPGSYLNFAPIDNTGTSCFGGLQSSSGVGVNIFGLTFIKSQFIVFNGAGGSGSSSKTPQIGFAKKAS